MNAVLRYTWAFPASMIGLIVGFCGFFTGSRFALRRGVLEIHGGAASWFLQMGIPGIGEMPAMTLGHVVLGRNRKALRQWRKHELVHVRQYEKWGPFLIPTMFLCALWLKATGGDPYYDNPFEREAYGKVRFPHEVRWRRRRPIAKPRFGVA